MIAAKRELHSTRASLLDATVMHHGDVDIVSALRDVHVAFFSDSEGGASP
jgi:hypothetical protein